MKILIACESSGKVRDRLIALGHNATSCDLEDGEGRHTNNHYKGPVEDILDQDWDMLCGFPPCTNLCVSGARWFKQKQENDSQQRSIDFFMMLANADIPKIALENPIGIMSTQWRKPDQIIQPWQYGHGETKATCLWLKGLPKLIPTDIVEGRENRIHKMAPSPDRWKKRSETYDGIANAMANQWGI